MELALHNLLDAALIAAVTIVAILVKNVSVVAIAWIKVKIGDTNTKTLKDLATTVVRFLAQTPAFEALETEAKKEYAINFLTDKCKELNLPFTHEDIDKFIEEAVQIMKTELSLTVLDFTSHSRTYTYHP